MVHSSPQGIPPKEKKIRVIFDCTVKYQGIALNEQLIQEPDLTNTLIGVLLRFRGHPVALMVHVLLGEGPERRWRSATVSVVARW